jgi:hypothetical protein
MGYLHPHTTLTLLEGYERDATEAAAAASTAAARTAAGVFGASGTSSTGDAGASSADGLAGLDAGSSSSSTVCQVTGWPKARTSPDPTMLLHSWATGGSWLKSQAAKSSSSAGDSAPATSQQQQQQGEGLLSPEAAAAAAVGSGGLQAAGSDWAATAAKAAQLRSVIEWGVEAYGVEEGSQQDGDVSVVIWPGKHHLQNRLFEI